MLNIKLIKIIFVKINSLNKLDNKIKFNFNTLNFYKFQIITVKAFVVTSSWNVRNFGH